MLYFFNLGHNWSSQCSHPCPKASAMGKGGGCHSSPPFASLRCACAQPYTTILVPWNHFCNGIPLKNLNIPLTPMRQSSIGRRSSCYGGFLGLLVILTFLMCFRLKLFWELNPNMAYIYFGVWIVKKKPKRKLKLLWELNPNMGYISWSLNYEEKTKKKAPQIFVWLEEEFWISSRIVLRMKLLRFVGFHKACGQTHIVTTMKGGDIAKGWGLWHGYHKMCFFLTISGG